MPVYKKLSELLSKNLANKDGIHFYFLRHGQSTLNMTNSVVGWTDVELSPKGRDQSMKINKALLPHIESFTSIHTSDLKRCKETLRLSFGFTDSNNLSHKITESQNLRQLNFGDDQGVLIDSLPQDYKKLMHSLHYKAPNGQNWPSARQRAMKYLTSVSKVGHHFVSTHGGLMCALMHHLGLKEVVPNCSLISVEFCPTQKDFTKLNFEWRNPQ